MVVGDDERAQVIVRDVLRKNELPGKRFADLLFQELGRISSVRELGRLTDGPVSGNELGGPRVRLAQLARESRYRRWKTLPEPRRPRGEAAEPQFRLVFIGGFLVPRAGIEPVSQVLVTI
jgi:hypothetical protein